MKNNMTKLPVIDIEPPTKMIIRTESALVTAQALEKEAETRKLIRSYIAKNLKKGTDFYELNIGGRISKPSLSKPGSEKFMSLFHLRAEFEKDADTWSMSGNKEGLICYVCRLYTKGGQLVGEGRGARDVIKDNGDYNKAIKMSQKSAQIDSILRTGALSDFFTQDLEDMKDEKLPEIQTEKPLLPEIEGLDKIEKQKQQIMKLLNGIFKSRLKDKADIEYKVKEFTTLELVEENYSEIINRLGIVYKERK